MVGSKSTRADRTRRRLPCALFVDKRRHAGVVLDLSASGVFVQTSATPGTGERVTLECHLPGDPQPSRLETRVARRNLVPARLRTVAHGGLGLRIESAPETYYSFVARLLREEVARATKPAKPVVAAEPAAAPPRRRPVSKLQRQARELALRRALGPRVPEERKYGYRLRVQQGTRSRLLTVEAACEEQARADALAQLGEGWQIVSCEPAD